MGRGMDLTRSAGVATLIAGMSLVGTAQAQVAEYVYQATRYMPQGESQNFTNLADAEAYIRVEPATPRGNAFLRKAKTLALSDGEALLQYEVPRRAYETYLGGYYDGHMSGNWTDCFGQKCRSEEEMVAASMRAYPLSGAYTPTLRGAYLSPPFKMWGSNGRNADVVMNAVQYSGESIPNERQITATNAAGHSYTYRINRTDIYQCHELFTAVDNAFGEPNRGVWPMICLNTAQGSIRVRFKQRAPFCQAPSDRPGNPCAADFGNKEYREDDFSWDGFDFRRAYNSIADFPLSSGFGDNWSHTFSDRLMFDNAGYATYWVRSDGYVERLYTVESGKHVYFSPNTSNLTLTAPAKGPADPAEGVWKLSAPGQQVTWFDRQGRVLRKQIAGTSVDLQYCGGAELGSDECPSQDLVRRAVNSRGRVLEFAYTVLPGTVQDVRLVSIKSEGRVRIQYVYDPQGRMTSAWRGGVAGAGRRYFYGEAGLLCKNASGAVIVGCDPAKFPNHLTGIEDELSVRFANYSYDDKGRATISEHAGGAGRVAIDYVSATQSRATLASGAVRTFGYTNEELKKLSGVATTGGAGDPGQSTSVGYDNRWRVAYTGQAGGGRSSFGYQGTNEVSLTEGLGENGEATPLTRTTQTDWNLAYNEIGERRVLNSAGAVVSRKNWTYNERGQPLVATDIDPVSGQQRATTTTYCEQTDIDAGRCPVLGQIVSIDGPRTDVADVTRYSYYPTDAANCSATPSTACDYRKGDPWKSTDALGRSVEMLRYDASGRILSSKDENAVVTDREYSDRGWLVASKIRGPDAGSETDDRITRFEYWPTGQVKKTTLSDGVSLTYGYDAAQRLTEVADNAGNRIRYTLDNDGKRLKEETFAAAGALKRVLSRVYNAMGQLQANQDAALHAITFRYDARGNQDRVTDALGRINDRTYDPLNRLVRTLRDVGGLAVETKFEYDALDRQVKIVDPKGLETVYGYNGFGDRIRQSSPDTGVTEYAFNEAGSVASKRDADDAQAHRYTYDALNRLTAIHYSQAAAADVEYDYDAVNAECGAGETFALGRLTAARANGTELRYCYDRFGQVVRKVQTVSGRALTVGYGYTAGGRLRSVTYPGGATVDYVHNAQGRVSEVGVVFPGGVRQVLLSAIVYEPFGPVGAWQYANGRVLRRTYDQNYRAESIVAQGGAGLSVRYGYNDPGELAEIVDPASGAVLAKYSYDALGRLTHTRDGATNVALETYAYDGVGNRLSLTHGGVTTGYGYAPGSHRLASVGGSPLQYNAVGNPIAIEKTALGLAYDGAGRLNEAKRGGAVVATYRYNAKGERVTASRPGVAQDLDSIYDEEGNWLGDFSASQAGRQIVWLAGAPVALFDGAGASSIHYVEPDRGGSPRTVVHPARNVPVWSWPVNGEAFGAGPPDQDPDRDGTGFVFDLRFPGQRYDSALGANYNYMRTYFPEFGRYVESDPIGLRGGISTYAYGNGDPLGKSDRFGLFSGADVALVKHFLGFSNGLDPGRYMDISAWCDDYIADASVASVTDSLQNEVRHRTRQLAGTLSPGQSVQFTRSRQDELYVLSIYSFGNGLFHSQTVNCTIMGAANCCASAFCRSGYGAQDYFKDPVDLCQAGGACGAVQNVGGAPFWFGLSCSGIFSLSECKNSR
ncbi:RHS repeat protein [Lysobacter enzymogenes]|uniref:RHS repeat protein n=1 Tax=Lysobacter enzymogenes TaxID=69 RepID=A0A3N2RKU4_LYSEN|nr:RHS repeat protein [Lysobacter enzymogenes]